MLSSAFAVTKTLDDQAGQTVVETGSRPRISEQFPTRTVETNSA
jgi:hypothetical protein